MEIAQKKIVSDIAFDVTFSDGILSNIEPLNTYIEFSESSRRYLLVVEYRTEKTTVDCLPMMAVGVTEDGAATIVSNNDFLSDELEIDFSSAADDIVNNFPGFDMGKAMSNKMIVFEAGSLIAKHTSHWYVYSLSQDCSPSNVASESLETVDVAEIPVVKIGDAALCGELWEMQVLSQPNFDVLVLEPPKGVYAEVTFLLKNLQNQTSHINQFSDKIELLGLLDGRTLAFEATSWGPSNRELMEGIVYWSDDIPPLTQVKSKAIFDVNPGASDWRLRLTVDESSGNSCVVEIDLLE